MTIRPIAAVLALFGTALIVIVGALTGIALAAEAIHSPAAAPTVTTPAWADGCTTDTDCAAMERSLNDAGLYLVGNGAVAEREDAGWMCSLGTGDCTGWEFITSDLADALAEGDDTAPENAATRNWEACVIAYGDTSLIVCPDGFTTTS